MQAPASAQSSGMKLQGYVLDNDTGDPLAGVHVFIASSMIGTTTDAEGAFLLENLSPGALRLHVSMVGFQGITRNLFLEEGDVLEEDFYLKPQVFELGSITVEAGRNRKWNRQLRRFNRLFIGETANAKQTTILNPEVLSFEQSAGGFKAFASEPLIIENLALGFRIQYFLIEFNAKGDLVQYQGEPLFEAIEATSTKQMQTWKNKRDAAFNGSLRHFLYSLIDDQNQAQEYKFYLGRYLNNGQFKRKYELKRGEILKPGHMPSLQALNFDNTIELIYLGEEEEAAYLSWINQSGRQPGMQTSWLELSERPAMIDQKGELLNPYSITVSGYMGFARVADSLPKEYRPY